MSGSDTQPDAYGFVDKRTGLRSADFIAETGCGHCREKPAYGRAVRGGQIAANPDLHPGLLKRGYAAGLQNSMRISLICTGCGDVAETPMSKYYVPAN